MDDETLRFLLALQGSNGPQQLEDLWRMWQYRSAPDKYRGRCGYAIGTERYIEALEGEIFGSRFSGRALSQGDYSYGDSLASDLQGYALQLCEDTSLTPTDEYMTYESRRQMLDAAEQLARVTYFDRGRLEAHLERLRRLEGFDNQIIEFDTSGEVRAKMCWDNGRNVMYIEADVCFKQYALNGDVPMPMPPPPMVPAGSSFNYEAYQEKKRLYDEDQSREFERRVTHAIFNFEQWGGNYQVFGNQALEVNVKINRVYSSRKAAVVHVADINIKGARSFATGQIFPHPFGWNPEKSKYMGLLDNFTDKATAVHEFGHWLGLQDAYAIDNRQWIPLEIAAAIATGGVSKEKGRHMVNYLLEKGGSQDFINNGDILGPYPLYGVPEGVYPDYDSAHSMMAVSSKNNISNNDMEMIVLAFQTGQRQNYQVQFPWEIISQAMGRGN